MQPQETTQVVTVKRTFTCGRCNRPAVLAGGEKPDRLTFLSCPHCGTSEGTITQVFGNYPFHLFNMDVEAVSV